MLNNYELFLWTYHDIYFDGIFFHSYEWMYKSIIHIQWSKRIRKSGLMINIPHEAPLVLSTVHAHLSDKLSELYDILRRIQTWIHVRYVAYDTCQGQPQGSSEGKRSFESSTRYRSSSTRQSGPRQFHRKVSKQRFSNYSYHLAFLSCVRQLITSVLLPFCNVKTWNRLSP